MRLSKTTAGVLATGALMFAVPAVASASPASPASTPSATSSQFAQVTDGQTMAQVAQEMGSAGILTSASSGPQGVNPNAEVSAWNDSSLGLLGGAVRFSIDFNAPAVGQPLVVTGKTALGV